MRVTEKDEDRLIIAVAKVEPFLSTQEIEKEIGINTSCDTIRRHLKEAGLI